MSRPARCLARRAGGRRRGADRSPHRRARAAPTPDDPVFEQGLQWGLERIDAPSAWRRGTGDGVTIAVVDSGVDLAARGPGRQGRRPRSAASAPTATPAACHGPAQDDNGHGTHVAGIALAATGNGRGIAGVAPDADLLAVRVLAEQLRRARRARPPAPPTTWPRASGGRPTTAPTSSTCPWAAARCRACSGCAFCDAVEYAWSAGAIPVIAAGNDSVLPGRLRRRARRHRHRHQPRRRTRASYSNASSGLLRERPLADRRRPAARRETAASDCATGGTPKGVLSTYWVERPPRRVRLPGRHVDGGAPRRRRAGRAAQHGPLPAGGRRPAARHRPGPRPGGPGRAVRRRAHRPRARRRRRAGATPPTTTGPAPTTTARSRRPAPRPPPPPPATTTTAPQVERPRPEPAAPFSPTGRRPPTDGPPAGSWPSPSARSLASAAATAATAWHLAETDGPTSCTRRMADAIRAA